MPAMKTKIIEHFGEGNISATARAIGIDRPRVVMWPENLTRLQLDGVVSALVRKSGKRPACVPEFIWEEFKK